MAQTVKGYCLWPVDCIACPFRRQQILAEGHHGGRLRCLSRGSREADRKNKGPEPRNSLTGSISTVYQLLMNCSEWKSISMLNLWLGHSVHSMAASVILLTHILRGQTLQTWSSFSAVKLTEISHNTFSLSEYVDRKWYVILMHVPMTTNKADHLFLCSMVICILLSMTCLPMLLSVFVSAILYLHC